MQESKTKVTHTGEIFIMDYVNEFLRYKKFVFRVVIGVMVAVALVSLLIPSKYIAETKILPPQSGNSSMASLMATQMAGMGLPAAGLGMKSSNDLYLALLKTRPVADYVIGNNDLLNAYKSKSKSKVRRFLAKNLIVRDDKKSGIISVGFRYSDPQKAAEIANAYVQGLQVLMNTLAVTEAGQRRLFFEEQLKAAKENLIKSEESLKYFQQRTGTIKIDDETKAVIGTVAEMRARISAKEVQLRVMRSYATPENPDLLRLQDENRALKEELRRMESNSRQEDDTVPTLGKMSSIGTEYIRRMREFKYNEALYDILMKQFEAARIDESRDAAIVQVVEQAEVPEDRSSPNVKSNTVKAGAIALFLILFLIVAKRYLNSEYNITDEQICSSLSGGRNMLREQLLALSAVIGLSMKINKK